jgi:glucosylceramidase
MKHFYTQAVENRRHQKVWLCLLAAWLVSAASGQEEIKLYVSSKAGDRLAAKPPVKSQAAGDSSQAWLRIDDSVTYQTIAGFGASFLEAGLICINSLPPDAQEAVLRALFSPEVGAGFSAMKTTIACTDFMSAGPWYTYDDHPGDVEMAHFSVARDLGTNGLITYIKRARKYGAFQLQAPMDYPPDWMLLDLQHNQDVNPKYYDALARYYLRYLQEYERNGVFIDYLSLFNEPGVYTKIPYNEIRDLLKSHVGPRLQSSGLKTRLMLSESPVRGDALAKYPTVLDDPEARKFVAVLAYHGYDLKDHDKIARLHQRYPDLPLWMTEICHAYEAGTSKQMKLPREDFEDGDFWGQQIFSDLEAGASAWIYWNMILDEKGGPWAISPIHGNPDPNVQHPVVVINRETQKITYTGLYYYLAHFSKFIRPGAVRVAVHGAQDGIRCLAFRGADKGLITELMNSRNSSAEVYLARGARTLKLSLPPVSITTCLWDSKN